MSDETKGVDWEALDAMVERISKKHSSNCRIFFPGGDCTCEQGSRVWSDRMLVFFELPAIRAEMQAKDLKIYRLESEVTLLRLNAEVDRNLSVHVAALRATLTATYNAAMWLASDETGREVPKWVYEAIEAAQKLGATK